MNFTRYYFHFAVFVILGLAGFLPALGQTKDKIIECPVFAPGQLESAEKGLNPSGLKEVLELTNVTVAGRSIVIGQPFSAEEEWVKSLVFKMKNVSGKSIVGVRISFGLPETRTENNMLGFSFEYGKGLSTGIASDEQKIIKPGEEFELKFNEAQHQRHKKFLSERSSLNSSNKLLIGIIMAKLMDDSIWSTRCLHSSNPSNSCQ